MAQKILKPPRGAHRNRKAGHKFELQVRDAFKVIGFPHVVSCRSESRSRDAEKIDLINKDERVNGRLPYNVQCKNTTRKAEYHTLLKEIPQVPGVMNVVVHKMTSNKGKTNKQGTFAKLGTYAILSFEDFMFMAAVVQAETVRLANRTGIPTLDLQTKKNGTEIY
jgi:hypothetical protein